MRTETIALDTTRSRIVDITDDVRRFAQAAGSDGIVHIFAPHATAGLALMETGAGSELDLLDAIEAVLPRDDRYRHAHGSPGHGADHVLPAFVAPSLVVPVVEGDVAFGTWQSVVFVDTNIDNPRRTVRLSFVPG